MQKFLPGVLYNDILRDALPVPADPKRKPELGPGGHRRSETETETDTLLRLETHENVGTPGAEAVRGHEASAMQLRRFM